MGGQSSAFDAMVNRWAAQARGPCRGQRPRAYWPCCVYIDEGAIGLGETVDKVPGAKGAWHGPIAPLVLGQNPLDIEGL